MIKFTNVKFEDQVNVALDTQFEQFVELCYI